MKGANGYRDGEHFVYRVFDDADRLLYIGCTEDVNARMAVHRAWGNPSPASYAIKLYGSRTESVAFDDFVTARRAEREAIAAERPHFNREHNPTRWTRIDGQWMAIGGEYEPTPRPVNSELIAVLGWLGSTERRRSA